MEPYEELEIKVVVLDADDVIATSYPDEEGGKL